MKILYLLRHAKASKDPAFVNDLERPLTEEGIRDAKMVSQALHDQKIRPQKIISSPAARAYSTALIFSTTFGMRPDLIGLSNDLYESSVEDYRGVISGIEE